MSVDFKQPELKVPRPKPFHLETGISWPDVASLAPPSPTPSSSVSRTGPESAPEKEPALAATPPVLKTEYVDRGTKGKAQMLLGVMNDSKAILTQNGIPEGNDNILSSLMMTEGGRNGRRSTLGMHFKSQAAELDETLKKTGLDRKALTDNPKAREELERNLPEDQRFLLNRVISGQLDLHALNSKEELAKLTNAGIDKRVEQYKEMERLKQERKEKGGLKPEDQQRLGSLEAMDGDGVGFDKKDHEQKSKFGDMTGLSEARFREIYQEGQQRFEPHVYRKARSSFDNQVDDYVAGDQKKSLTISAGGVGDGNLDPEAIGKMHRSGNHDLLADLSTSYGTSQIMGLYAYIGDLRAKNAQGEKVNYDLPTLKHSMDRLSPTTEDVNMQVAFLNMKAGYKSKRLGESLNDIDSLITLYNGAQPGSDNHTGYKNRMVPAKAEYDGVKKEEEERKEKAQRDSSRSPSAVPLLDEEQVCKASEMQDSSQLMSPLNLYAD